MSSNKLRVVAISRGWWYIVFGGAERFIHSISKELHFMGYEVIGLTRLIGNKEAPNTPYKLIYYTESKLLPLISSIKFSIYE